METYPGWRCDPGSEEREIARGIFDALKGARRQSDPRPGNVGLWEKNVPSCGAIPSLVISDAGFAVLL